MTSSWPNTKGGTAVAVYAAGGRKALADYGDRKGGVARQLTHQVK